VDNNGATEQERLALLNHAIDLLTDICQDRMDKVANEAVEEEDFNAIEEVGLMQPHDVERVLTILRAESASNKKTAAPSWRNLVDERPG
jgi:hypothetical protein